MERASVVSLSSPLPPKVVQYRRIFDSILLADVRVGGAGSTEGFVSRVRLGNVDPRLALTLVMALELSPATVDGALVPLSEVVWPNEDLIRVSAYPLVSGVLGKVYGAPADDCDLEPLYPIVRDDGTVVGAQGFSIDPSIDSYVITAVCAPLSEAGIQNIRKFNLSASLYVGARPGLDRGTIRELVDAVSFAPDGEPVVRAST